mmetsp:Transcript_7467/g.20371  ORF Transcript_7467/g.20371 Transcript_7467/m.20371 type:complete len:226 (+) Transcript_7467:1671-2348(+)
MRCPHHSCLDTHQSLIFSIQRNQVASYSSGMISSSLLLTSSQPSAAMSPQATHHCGLSTGSMTSLEREHSPRRMGLSSTPRNRPISLRCSTTVILASKRRWPANCPVPFEFRHPSSSRMLINSRLWRFPVAKSFGSWAGVIFTAPVPKSISTSSASAMIGILRPLMGWTRNLPTTLLYLSSSGCTATAVSPSMVSGRVVATTISPEPSSYGYANEVMAPNSTGSS